eukprot:3816856-Amphidinium_carterae.1
MPQRNADCEREDIHEECHEAGLIAVAQPPYVRVLCCAGEPHRLCVLRCARHLCVDANRVFVHCTADELCIATTRTG